MAVVKKMRLSQQDQILFLAELGELIASGYPLRLSLDVLASAHPSWQQRLNQVNKNLNQGQNLAVSLGQVLSPFLGIYLALGQAHGHFDQTLTTLAVNYDQVFRYRQKLQQLLTYPLFIFLFLLTLMVGMETYLYPVFQTLTETDNAKGLGNNPALFYLHGLTACFVLMILVAVLFIFILRHLTPWQRIRVVSRLPILKNKVQTILTALLAEHLGILLVAGHTLPQIIDYFAQVSIKKRSFLVAMAQEAQVAVQSGITLEEWLQSQSFLKANLSTYLNRGFTSSVLGTYLTYYAKSEFQRFDQQMNRFLGWVQPCLFAAIGLTIILLYLAMLLPLYKNLGGLPL